jgi:methylase of polypeptide subunit release factors
LFDERDIESLRTALGEYTVEAVHELIGPVGQAALTRGDLAGVARQVSGDQRLSTLVRLFILGGEVPERAAEAAFRPLPLDLAYAAGLLTASNGAVRALIDVRPHAQESGLHGQPAANWWVVSDFGSDVRDGPLAADHVLGVGAASVSLAQATPREPIEAAVDIGTGCGVQALHLGTHASRIVATDVSERALRFAATSAALSGQHWDLRRGSMSEPLAAHERFDLVVANPPFVVGAGSSDYDYRDAGVAGDGFCEALVRGIPRLLKDGGTAQLLANWIIPVDRDWDERVADWLLGTDCDAWVWQREVADLSTYVGLWLRDAGERPGTRRWTEKYDAWLDWFAANEVAAVGMGLITLWRTDAVEPVIVLEDVRQVIEQPIGAELPRWIARQRWLAAVDDHGLLATCLVPAPELVRTTEDLLGTAGWAPAATRMRQTRGMRWEVDVDDSISALVAGCDRDTPLSRPVEILAAALGVATLDLARAALPVIRDLIGRGFLVPAGLAP